MSGNYLKYPLALLLLLTSPASLYPAENFVMEPAPVDRPIEQRPRQPGEFKRNKWGLIDPTPDAVSLTYLPKDAYGFIDWVKAMDDGIIKPRGSIGTDEPEEAAAFDKEILIRSKLDFMPDVIFPHAPHNAWLKCGVCHPKIFKMQKGGNDISMTGIWKGKFCGRCHDRVAFPIRNCFKCHSAPRLKTFSEGKRATGCVKRSNLDGLLKKLTTHLSDGCPEGVEE